MRANRLHLTAAIAWTLACCVATSATAQVRWKQGGDALDASPMVGSNGRNSRVSNRDLGDLLENDLYVSGQVSGLGAFRARANRPLDTFGLDLPTSAQDSFMRRSVGLQQALGGNTYRTQPYFSESQTVLSAGGIANNRNALATNRPFDARGDRAIRDRLYNEAIQQFRSSLPNQPGRRLDDPLQRFPLPELADTGLSGAAGPYTIAPSLETLEGYGSGVIQSDVQKRLRERYGVGADDESATALRLRPEPLRPGATALFGVIDPERRRLLLTRSEDRDRARAAETDASARVEARVEGGVRAEYQLGQRQELSAEWLGKLAPDMKRALAGDDRKAMMPRRNADVFRDLLVRLHEKAAGMTPDRPRPAGSDIVEMSRQGDIVIHRLGGLAGDRTNRLLRSAEHNLLMGEYYLAAQRFSLVLDLAGEDPRALVGKALSYFGAGEPYTAGVYLRRAFLAFPPLMKTRLNLPEMMSSEDIFRQLEGIVRRERASIHRNPDVHVLFAAAVFRWNLQQTDEAERLAGLLLKEKDAPDVIHDFARMVLKEASAPTTQPAEGS